MSEIFTVSSDWKGSQQLYANGSVWKNHEIYGIISDFIRKQGEFSNLPTPYHRYTYFEQKEFLPFCHRVIAIGNAFKLSENNLSCLQKTIRAVRFFFNDLCSIFNCRISDHEEFTYVANSAQNLARKRLEEFQRIEKISNSNQRNLFFKTIYDMSYNNLRSHHYPSGVTDFQRGLGRTLASMRADPRWAEDRFERGLPYILLVEACNKISFS